MSISRSKAYPKVKGSIPGKNAKKWADFHLKHGAISTYDTNFVWDRRRPAKGPWCHDVDGNLILDFCSHVASSPLGYNNPELVKLSHITKTLPNRYAGTDFLSGYGPDPKKCDMPTPSHLHHKLMEVTKCFGFAKSFFSNTGAEAVENAIKICYDYRKNNGYGICFDGAFHGRSIGALSLNRSKKVQRKWIPWVKTVSVPYWSRGDAHAQGWMVQSRKGEMSALRSMMHPEIGNMNPDEIPYIILEPMQGEGGYNVAKKEFMKEVQEVARDYHIPLIVDEIQAGMGRSGKFWCSEHYKLKPDLITSSKALQVGATIGKSKIFPKESGRLGGTWAEGNAHATAMGYTIIDIIQKQKLVENADTMGAYLRKRLTEFQDKYSCITDVRGLGLLDAIELKTKKQQVQVTEGVIRKGLLLEGCGYRSVRFLPPLDVKKREIDVCLDILEGVLKTVR